MKMPLADVIDFEKNKLCKHNSKTRRKYAKAKLLLFTFLQRRFVCC